MADKDRPEKSSTVQEPLTLSERIKEDFGIDIPIRGGHGSASDPYEVTVSNTSSAATAVTRMIGVLAHANRWAWRILEATLVPGTLDTLRVRIERVIWTDREVISELAAYYFRFPTSAENLDLMSVAGCKDTESEICLPFQIGWLHYKGGEERMGPDMAGLGHSASYAAPGVKVTIFVYRRPPTSATNSDAASLSQEFERAENELLHAAQPISDNRRETVNNSVGELQSLYGIYRLEEQGITALMITMRNDYFVKVRATMGNDEKAVELGMSSVMELFELLQPPPTSEVKH
jgi:hypothetical protein